MTKIAIGNETRDMTPEEQAEFDALQAEAALEADANKIIGIKAEANRRIEEVMPTWMVAREVSGGAAIPQDVKDYAEAVRAASGVIEGTLPDDYTDDIHWPLQP
jgi:hypothetical protein